MLGLLVRRHRRRRGDDVQRVRPGPRGREPGDRRAVHAGGLQRHLLRGRRRRHAAGRASGPTATSWPTTRRTRTSPPASSPPRSQGWVYCRDNPESCRDIVVAAGSQLGDSHQLWQMNEVNKLIWPSTDGIGTIDEAAWDRTVEIAQNTPNLEGTTVLTAPPTDGAYTNEIVEAAIALLGDSRRHGRRRLQADRGHPRTRRVVTAWIGVRPVWPRRATRGQAGATTRWPASGTTTSSAAGMRAAHHSPWAGDTTRVGVAVDGRRRGADRRRVEAPVDDRVGHDVGGHADRSLGDRGRGHRGQPFPQLGVGVERRGVGRSGGDARDARRPGRPWRRASRPSGRPPRPGRAASS